MIARIRRDLRNAACLAGGAVLLSLHCGTSYAVSVGPSYSIDIVDVLDAAWASEDNSNPEPTIAVNPTNANEIVVRSQNHASSSCGNGDDLGGYSISLDGGTTWSTRCVLPLYYATLPPTGYYSIAGDMTMKFTGDGSKLIAAYIAPATDLTVRVQSITGWATDTPIATDLLAGTTQANGDQPFIATKPNSADFTVGLGPT